MENVLTNSTEILKNDPLTKCFGTVIILVTIAFVSWKFIRKRFVGARLQKPKTMSMNETLDHENAIMQKYDLTCNGFLPVTCLQSLPEYYNEWENIAANLPQLNQKGELRMAVNEMSLLNCDQLENESMRRRAYIILGMIVHSFVNGRKVPWEDLQKSNHPNREESCNDREKMKNDDVVQSRNLPPQLAIPWYHVCKMLDLPYVLTAALDLWNWKLKDPSKPITLFNLTSITTMSGTDSEVYFHMVPCAMHAAAAPFIPRTFTFYKILEQNHHSYLLTSLLELTKVFDNFRKILSNIKDLVDQDIFYNVYRPLLAGFFPDGLVLQLTYNGGHQSTIKRLPLSTDEDDCPIRTEEPMVTHLTSLESNETEEKPLDDMLSGPCQKSLSEFRDQSSRVQSASLDGDSNVNDVIGQDVNSSNENAPHKDNTPHAMQFGCDSVVKRYENGCLEVDPKGPSAGQSTMFILFDMLLGIRHWGAGQEFQEEMLNYMPRRHREMAVDLGRLIVQHGNWRDIVLDSKDGSYGNDLIKAFNSCIRSVASFRALHLGIVIRYLVRTKKGTGASSFREMLDGMVKGTTNALIHEDPTN